ncbi:Arfaptin homology (AH) domain/BAR domain [Phytophthora cactorum]|nr:Arfaptin homology (AH) domain/BAR domain [Phytophthora cactorum]
MLQGLRRKIGRYAPRGGVKETPEEEEEMLPLKADATPIEVAVWHFNRQDKAFRRLETHLTQMLDQIQVDKLYLNVFFNDFLLTNVSQVACATMATVAEIFSETCSDEEQNCVGADYKSAMKQIEQQEAERMEQSIRFTVLDPLQATLERHDQLRKEINARDKLATESKLLRAVTLKMQSSGLEDDDKRAQTELDLHRVAAALQDVEASLLPQLEHANQSGATRTMDLFSTTKEIVAEANQPLKIPAIVRNTSSCVALSVNSKLTKMSSSTSDGWTEVDGSNSSTAPDGVETVSGSDEDDESNGLSITLEDFEAGKIAPHVHKPEDAAMVQITAKSVDTFKLVTLASYPVVTPTIDTSASTNSPRKVCLAYYCVISLYTRLTVSLASLQSGEQLLILQSPTEWLAIEDCLWEIDVRDAKSPGKSLLPTHSVNSNTDDLLYGLLQKNDTLYLECLSYLRVEDLARLSKVNFGLHSHLVDSAPIWKKCIRSGGLSPAIRSSLWLSVFYESTPWRSSAIASHYLSADRRCSMYDQLLTKVGMKLADGLVEGLPVSDDDAQLAVWFREIDVDVVRTCHRSIYARTTGIASNTTSETSTSDADNAINDSVASILNEMVDTIERREGEEDSVSNNYATGTKTLDPDLEAKLRRVLRAYVVYNPRVGYCQGMGFLVRLLAEVAEDEADIFWLFVGFSEPENDRNLYEPGMAVLQPYLSKFEVLFSTHMPELYTHFQTEGVHVATFCTRWFLTFFSSFETLTPTLVTRLLDIFIIDGWRIMFSVSLVILDELQQQLLKSDMEGILRVLQFPRCYMPEPDQLRQRQLVRHALAFSISRAINSI